MPQSLQDTKSHQGFVTILLVKFGVSVNWRHLSHFKLPTEKRGRKNILKLKRLNNQVFPLNFNASPIVDLKGDTSVGSAYQ